MKTGLVLGKFAPLHRGHQLLIETARAAVNQLYVLIYEMPELKGVPGLSVRASWVRQLFPDVLVIEGWGAPSSEGQDLAVMAEQEAYIRQVLPTPITHFFSSEWYGAHVAAALGATDVRVDMDRVRIPISARLIREKLFEYRAFLDPLIYRDLVKKIVFLGAESTGKTSLSNQMAVEFQTVWMPEHGRSFWEENKDEQGQLSGSQLVTLAQEHIEQENRLLLDANSFLFVDTNALSTRLFSLFYHGTVPYELELLADQAANRYDYTFVCANDFPYVEDGTRNGESHRQLFQKQILEDLHQRNIPFTLLTGPISERISHARTVLNRVIF